MKFKTLVIIGVSMLVVVGTFGGWMVGRLAAFRLRSIPATSPQAESLRWVEHADVTADFRQHVEREHDTRFLSVSGLSFATEFPGLTDTPEMHSLVHNHGVRYLEGTADLVGSIEQDQLLGEVSDYAARYNSMLVGYLEHTK